MNQLAKVLAHEFQLIQAAVMMPGAGGAVYQGVLPMNRCLTVGDCIASANGMFHALMDADGKLRIYRGVPGAPHPDPLWASEGQDCGGRFFALLQSDANFCVYRGADLAHNEGWHWGTQLTAEGGQFHAQLRDNGELCVYAGSAPHDAGEIVWRSGVRDPVVRIDRIDAIDYSLAGAQLGSCLPADLYRETVRNAGEQKQASTISGSVSVSDSMAWYDELGIHVSAPAGFLGAVPIVSGRKVMMSTDSGHAFVRNGSSTTARNWGFSAPAVVPPGSVMVCAVGAIRSAVLVPYTLRGAFTLASGIEVDGTVAGVYSGINCHDLGVSLSTPQPHATSAGSVTIERPLVPIPV